jgi:hypothetical protein
MIPSRQTRNVLIGIFHRRPDLSSAFITLHPEGLVILQKDGQSSENKMHQCDEKCESETRDLSENSLTSSPGKAPPKRLDQGLRNRVVVCGLRSTTSTRSDRANDSQDVTSVAYSAVAKPG